MGMTKFHECCARNQGPLLAVLCHRPQQAAASFDCHEASKQAMLHCLARLAPSAHALQKRIYNGARTGVFKLAAAWLRLSLLQPVRIESTSLLSSS